MICTTATWRDRGCICDSPTEHRLSEQLRLAAAATVDPHDLLETLAMAWRGWVLAGYADRPGSAPPGLVTLSERMLEEPPHGFYWTVDFLNELRSGLRLNEGWR